MILQWVNDSQWLPSTACLYTFSFYFRSFCKSGLQTGWHFQQCVNKTYVLRTWCLSPWRICKFAQHVLQLCCAFGMLMVRPCPIQYFQEQATQENILCNFLLNANQHGTQAYKQDFAVCRSKISQIWTTAAGTTLKKLPLVLQSFFGLQIGMVGWAMFWRLPCILIFTKKLSVACHIKAEDSSELLWGFAQTLSSQWGIALEAKVFGPIGLLGNRLHCCTKIVPTSL